MVSKEIKQYLIFIALLKCYFAGADEADKFIPVTWKSPEDMLSWYNSEMDTTTHPDLYEDLHFLLKFLEDE